VFSFVGVQVWMVIKSGVRLPHRSQKFCSVRCANASLSAVIASSVG
jgi:hypothetical protein